MRGGQRQSKRANCLQAKKLGPHGEGFTRGIRLAEPEGESVHAQQEGALRASPQEVAVRDRPWRQLRPEV